MIRNLKVLIAAAMALAAFGAFGASGAHAAEEKFHCSVEPCTLTLQKDGTGTTAHQVFVVKGETHAGVKGATVSFTCNEITGEATVNTKTSTEATFTNLAYKHGGPTGLCTVAGQEVVKVDMNSCDYKFTSTGGGTTAGSVVHVECSKAGDGIELTLEGVACLKVTPLTTTATTAVPGVKYHDANSAPPLKTILTAIVSNIVLPAGAVDIVNTENATCKGFIGLKTIEGATYTTGNTNVIAETHPGGAPANVWFE